MPMHTIELSEDLNAFIDEQVKLGRHSSPDEVVQVALERYAQDVATELGLVTWIDRGVFDMAAFRSFVLQDRYNHSTQLLPATPELRDRIEKLIGPIPDIDIDLGKPIPGDSDL